ncbi:putative RNA-binding protein 19 isoform X1 [Mytilus galloprovincialis]|uniref:putative RNA-binding protein 19 isoform X1 n=1 Tax=Mytilus galloprovincialis TaxID=29158 RepID=UPI003F7C7740
MSRLIVKNLPNGIKEERLRTVFSTKGEITDCTLKFTKDGRFRKFAFIGYSKDEEAKNALNSLNKTFIDTARIQVEYAKDFGDQNKPRSWSQYSKDSSAFQAKTAAVKTEEKPDKASKSEKKKTAKDKALEDMMGELKDDPKFEEFLDAHMKGGKKQIWNNDEIVTMTTKKTESDNSDDENSDSGVEGTEMEVDKTEEDSPKKMSDLDYLKAKMADKDLLSDSDDSDKEDNSGSDTSDKESDSDDEGDKDEEGDTSDSSESEDKDNKSKSEDKDDKSESDDDDFLTLKKDAIPAKDDKEPVKQKYLIKLRGFTGYVDETMIREFFQPLEPIGVRIPKNAKKKPLGVAFIDFSTEKEWDEAMRKNKLFIGGKRILLKKMKEDTVEDMADVHIPAVDLEKQRQETAESEAAIADTGRLFVRNLPYICKDEDIEALFSKFGPLTETHLPIDTLTKKLKGFAFITYMMPEHAVRAFTFLDGTSFMGRMLHILPSKSKEDEDTVASEGSSFKTQKQAKQKAMAGSSHNWNTLFMGANAVANVMAQKYGTEKSQILDAEISGSLGVRMALGETQIVSETRDFLIDNGVVLDSFSQADGPRSKTVILVKNLPSGTKTEELQHVFSKHGTLGRVILPPSGITAIVEFLEPTEAKLAYKKLAYTKFQHVPLYLEWAPTEALKPLNQGKEDKPADKKEEDTSQKSEDEEDEEESAEPGSTLFVKNVNFDTSDEDFTQKFEKCGKIKAAYIAKKKDMKNPGKFLSMGYGFVEYMKKQSAEKAMKILQHTDLDGHQLELKISNKATIQPGVDKKKKQSKKEIKTSKILVRNVPFEATRREIYELFKVFGELKSVRLPKKLSGTGSHRGFGFVDFLTRQDAKRAFAALCHSTHLYGRRLVLEWAESAEDLDELRKKTAEHFHEDVPRKKMKKSSIMEQLESSELK